MYLKNFNLSEKATFDGFDKLRSITRSFVFISQNESTRFAAEGCIDVLRAANNLIGQEVYTWTNAIDLKSKLANNRCSTNQTLVLAGGIFDPWCVAPKDLPKVPVIIVI